MRIGVYIGWAITTIFYGAATVATFILATPRPSQTWFDHAMSPHYAIANNLLMPITVVGVVINWYLLFLPIYAIVKLQLPLARKVRIGIAFLLGFA